MTAYIFHERRIPGMEKYRKSKIAAIPGFIVANPTLPVVLNVLCFTQRLWNKNSGSAIFVDGKINIERITDWDLPCILVLVMKPFWLSGLWLGLRPSIEQA
jgi:hypothetical protein